MDVADLVAQARDGVPRAVSRLISLVEGSSPQLREVAAALAPHTGRAHVVGLTGSPGVGKSTSTAALVRHLRARGDRVGVLAIDPSSPFSGGALLGDRIRMGEHATDAGVFIRSMATRGHLGGLSWATPQALRVLDAAGFDVVLVETVGVGQSEVEVVGLADTTVVLLAPGMGDGIQAAKAGILEIADLFVVNKADRPGADRTAREIRQVMAHARPRDASERWDVPVLRTVATGDSAGDATSGVAEVVTTLDAHLAWLTEHGALAARRRHRAEAEVEAIALRAVRERWTGRAGAAALDDLADDVVAGRTDPYAAADRLLAEHDR
ncbi:methylmalonyl Co-A mutase-associated GTPase MeaB [Rhodococcus aerolatus]